VQTTRNLVAASLTELSAGVQSGHDDLGRRLVAIPRVRIDRDSSSVVGDARAAVRQQGDVDSRAVPGHRLVDGVVDDLSDELVQPFEPGGADVHARPLADGLEPFEDGDVLGRVAARFHHTAPRNSVTIGLRVASSACCCSSRHSS